LYRVSRICKALLLHSTRDKARELPQALMAFRGVSLRKFERDMLDVEDLAMFRAAL